MQQHLRMTAWIIAAIVLLAANQKGIADTIYSREIEFMAVKMTQEDLAKILRKLRNVLDSANNQLVSHSPPHLKLILSSGQSTVTIEDTIGLAEIQNAPDVCYKIVYSYWMGDAPISEVHFLLDDRLRNMSVGGNDASQVDTLFLLLLAEFREHETWLGGYFFRSIILLVFIMILVMMSVVLSALVRRGWVVALVVAGLFLGVMVTVPIREWIPGAAVYSAEASFFLRNSEVIGIIGGLIGIVSGMAWISRVLFRWLSRKADNAEEAAESPPGDSNGGPP